MRNIVAVVACFCVFLLVCGCGAADPLGRHAVSGTVTLDGAPLGQGSIAFQPIEGGTTSGGGVISAGAYSIKKEGGLPAGKYLVQINGVAPGTGGNIDPNTLPGEAPAPAKELIPPEWNTNSRETIEVKDSGPFEFKFEIKSK